MNIQEYTFVFIKVLRENIIPYFNEIFGAVSGLVADPDQTVKNGSELIDRLLKGILDFRIWTFLCPFEKSFLMLSRHFYIPWDLQNKSLQKVN